MRTKSKIESTPTLAAKLKELMGDTPQRAFAEKLGIPVARLSEVLCGHKKGFSVTNAKLVSDALSLPLALCLGL